MESLGAGIAMIICFLIVPIIEKRLAEKVEQERLAQETI